MPQENSTQLCSSIAAAAIEKGLSRRGFSTAAAAVDDRCGSRNSPKASPHQSESRRNRSAFIRCRFYIQRKVLYSGSQWCLFLPGPMVMTVLDFLNLLISSNFWLLFVRSFRLYSLVSMECYATPWRLWRERRNFQFFMEPSFPFNDPLSLYF